MHSSSASDGGRDRGFMMVALLIGMAVVAIWMTAALPSWRQQAQRSREEELIFRGEQYARAIVLFQEKNRGAPPPSIDILVSQHYLRKKWKDPITNCDFAPAGPGVIATLPPCPSVPQKLPGTSGQTTASAVMTGGQQAGGITGVRSQSPATSIKIYQQQQQHNYWQFDAALMRAKMGRTQQLQRPGDGRQGGDGRGGRQGGDAGRGIGPGRGGVGPGRGGPPPPPPPRPIGRGGL